MNPDSMRLQDMMAMLHKTKLALEPHALALRQLGDTTAQIEQQFAEWDDSTEQRLVEAVSFLAEGEPLPHLTAPEATMLWFRLDAAYDYLLGIVFWEKHFHPETEGGTLIVRPLVAWLGLLLIDLWKEQTFPTMRGMLVSSQPSTVGWLPFGGDPNFATIEG